MERILSLITLLDYFPSTFVSIFWSHPVSWKQIMSLHNRQAFLASSIQSATVCGIMISNPVSILLFPFVELKEKLEFKVGFFSISAIFHVSQYIELQAIMLLDNSLQLLSQWNQILHQHSHCLRTTILELPHIPLWFGKAMPIQLSW